MIKTYMAYISKICISNEYGKMMKDVQSVEVLSGKGIIDDRYFNDDNDNDTQITLIESENIDYYNSISNTNIAYIDFRRNIITTGIRLNELVNKEFFVGNVKLKGHRLCDPCKYLQDMLDDNKLVKKLFKKGGLRCEILTDGNISINEEIKTI